MPNKAGRLYTARLIAKLEYFVVAVSPVAAYFIFRIRLMSPADLPDPSMHTTFIVDPRAIFTRYSSLFTSTARLREGARVGFLVPARLSYILFGALDGFVVLRYLLVLIAIVPLYMLLTKTFSRAIGATGVLLVLTNPVIITALGTDYPDSAVCCYLVGAVSLLTLSISSDRKKVLLTLSGVLITLALWAQVSSSPYIGAILICYLLTLKSRRAFSRCVFILGTSFFITTCLLAALSGIELGQFNFISPTLHSILFLSSRSQESIWHSSSLSWLVGLPYLLVPIIVAGIFCVLYFGRRVLLSIEQLYLGSLCVIIVVSAFVLQLLANVQMLENHYFSSLIYGPTVVLLAVIIGILGKKNSSGRDLGWLSFMFVALVAFCFSFYHSYPSMYLFPQGILLVSFCIVTAFIGDKDTRSSFQRSAVLLSVLIVTMFLYVASTPLLVNLSFFDPRAQYECALGCTSFPEVSEYIVTAELPAFVGKPTYAGEILMMWFKWDEISYFLEPTGIFHSGFNSLPSGFPFLDKADVKLILERRPAQVLLIGKRNNSFKVAIQSLASFHPAVVKSGTLSSGGYAIKVTLLKLNYN